MNIIQGQTLMVLILTISHKFRLLNIFHGHHSTKIYYTEVQSSVPRSGLENRSNDSLGRWFESSQNPPKEI